MRDYKHIERYLNTLIDDIYPQSPDEGHQKSGCDIIHKWLPALHGLDTILDVGCGQGQFLDDLNVYADTKGITLGGDARIAKVNGHDVELADFSFLPYEEETFRLIFARHVIEHSPMPLLTLMEWYRVSKQWLLMIVPDVEHFGCSGKNHYYVLTKEQWGNLLNRAGWKPIWYDFSNSPVPEHRFMCERK